MIFKKYKKQSYKDPFLCFVHIERAGGTTLHSIIQHNYPSYIILKPWFRWPNQPGCYLRTKELRLLMKLLPFSKGVGGHTVRPYLDYHKILDRPFFYFTFLREPISRYISHFHLMHALNKKLDIESFVMERQYNNFQTVRLAEEENIEKARQVLKRNFHFMGLTERFDESLLLLKDKLGDKNFNIHYERLNISKEHTEIIQYKNLSKKVQQKILDNNKLDLYLYDYGLNEIYPTFRKQYSGNIKSDLISFKYENKTFSFPKIKDFILKLYQYINQYGVQPFPHLMYSLKNKKLDNPK